MKDQPSPRGGTIDPLTEGFESHTLLLEFVHHLNQMLERATQPVEESTQATRDARNWMEVVMWADMKVSFKGTFDRLGDILPNGGISSWLTKFGKSTMVTKALNALTLITVLHNAAHLSTSLVTTLGDALSVGLAAVGITDEQNNPIDINSLLGQAANSFMSRVVGEERWNDTKLIWQQFNDHG